MRTTLLNVNRTSFLPKVPSQTAVRMTKIRDLLGRAIGELRNDLKRSVSKSPVKRHSD